MVSIYTYYIPIGTKGDLYKCRVYYIGSGSNKRPNNTRFMGNSFSFIILEEKKNTQNHPIKMEPLLTAKHPPLTRPFSAAKDVIIFVAFEYNRTLVHDIWPNYVFGSHYFHFVI